MNHRPSGTEAVMSTRPRTTMTNRRADLALLATATALIASLVLGGIVASARPGGDGSPLRRLIDDTSEAGAPYTVLQMNLCLSGLAGCYGGADHPSVVEEAVATIEALDPGAVTLNEACSGDAARLAARTGYQVRFVAVVYRGAPLPCVRPGGRGVFGNAVLTGQRIVSSRDQAFAAQSGVEERRWVCATTARRVSVCATHLSTRGTAEAQAANDAQCRELGRVLASYAARGATVLGGDVNRQDSCAPAGMWTRTDAAAIRAPGIQHVYGSPALRAPVSRVVPATYTDHDFLLVDTRLAPAGRR